MKKLLRRIQFFSEFLPIQLFLANLKSSLVLLVLWAIMFGFVTNQILKTFGIPLLFLSPEYRGQVNFTSFLLVGMALGLFIMSYHIATYIFHSSKFPFLATLERPLYKFSLNNAFLPRLFFLVYVYQVITFQLNQENASPLEVLLMLTGLMVGTIVSHAIIFAYFFSTNKKILDYITPKLQKELDKRISQLVQDSPSNTSRRVRYYMEGLLKIERVRGYNYYPEDTLKNVINDHHRNAAILLFIVFASLIGMGYLSDLEFFRIPAASSIMVLLTFGLLFSGAIYTIFKRWINLIIILSVILLNVALTSSDLHVNYKAFGMDYKRASAPYSPEHLLALTTDSLAEIDMSLNEQSLDNWKNALTAKKQKPFLVVINTSGGGQRSAVWTFSVLDEIDKRCNMALLPQTKIITGASGGMLGATYYRELFRREKLGADNSHYTALLSKDLLNHLSFALAVNDALFLPRYYHAMGNKYRKDRGYYFEQQLLENLQHPFEKTVSAYSQDEYDAKIPQIIYTPTVSNDGRRMMISALPGSYLTYGEVLKPQDFNEDHIDAVEFMRFFEQQRADSLLLTTAIRMCATFPYVTPLVSLPSEPVMQVADAGIRDNLGYELSMRYVYKHRDWINENTSGVLFIRVLGDRVPKIQFSTSSGGLINPLQGLVDSYGNIQVFNNTILEEFSRLHFEVPLKYVDFHLFEEMENISLSWHLMQSEKKRLQEALLSEHNQNALRKIEKYFSTGSLLDFEPSNNTDFGIMTMRNR